MAVGTPANPATLVLLRDGSTDRLQWRLFLGFFDDVQGCRLADPVLDIRQARGAGQTDRIGELCVQLHRILGAQRLHRLDAEAADYWQLALHARDLEQRALMRKLEQALRCDASFLREPLAVDSERGAVKELVGVLDAARA